jgi:hypothetical protein
VNNRLLRELGWVSVKVGVKRDSPRNSELELKSKEELREKYKELVGLQKDAARFIKSVFHSSDSVWVDRCSEIIED